MPRSKLPDATREAPAAELRRSVTLRHLAEYLDLSPATVSLVMNRSPVADSIPQRTKDKILAAARELHYRPNHTARSLRKRRSFTIGVIVPEVSEGYSALVISGIEDYLSQAGYFYLVVSHRHRKDLLEEYAAMLLGRSVDGIIAVDTHYRQRLPIPVVAVSGHEEVPGVTNVVLNHRRAAFLALQHIAQMGHHEIAFIKGQDFSTDTEIRWRSIVECARELDLKVDPRLTAQLKADSPSPEVGYGVTKELLATGRKFTALFAFNDIAAIGAIRALREAGARIPEDVSVVGFDDIQSAAYHNPSLTTVRQPLREMGQIAAQTTVSRIAGPKSAPYKKLLVMEPELVVRNSTGPGPFFSRNQKR